MLIGSLHPFISFFNQGVNANSSEVTQIHGAVANTHAQKAVNINIAILTRFTGTPTYRPA